MVVGELTVVTVRGNDKFIPFLSSSSLYLCYLVQTDSSAEEDTEQRLTLTFI